MKLPEFIHTLQTQGRHSFAVSEAEQALGLQKVATLNAIRRMALQGLLVSPARGFYLIVPPEYQAYGCLPADMFIADLMNYFGQPYYVGYLSAAQYYGAAHQKPQRFQVVTNKNRRPIQCGRIYIEFIANRKVAEMPTKPINTLTGTINIATAEVLMADLVSSPHHAAGINNVATVLTELVESIDDKQLLDLSKINTELFWVQRLGYLSEFLGLERLVPVLEKILHPHKLHWVRLVSRFGYKTLSRNNKWKIIVNTEIETDL
ncbi:MAG TPA: type IV toxin-antitoxin system AbiEi family antitoxin [Gammaproteobacteria bacterium]|nr:type IV toxin-antitoxin system AbiEi family antitoxin [Gammaproteobacteria bacterium]